MVFPSSSPGASSSLRWEPPKQGSQCLSLEHHVLVRITCRAGWSAGCPLLPRCFRLRRTRSREFLDTSSPAPTLKALRLSCSCSLRMDQEPRPVTELKTHASPAFCRRWLWDPLPVLNPMAPHVEPSWQACSPRRDHRGRNSVQKQSGLQSSCQPLNSH